MLLCWHNDKALMWNLRTMKKLLNLAGSVSNALECNTSAVNRWNHSIWEDNLKRWRWCVKIPCNRACISKLLLCWDVDAAKSKLFYDNSITKQIAKHILYTTEDRVKTFWKLDDGEDYFTPSVILIKLKSLHAIAIRHSVTPLAIAYQKLCQVSASQTKLIKS